MSLDESSDLGLSLTHHKACQCAIQKRSPKRPRHWPHHGQGEEPWISLSGRKGRYRQDSSDYRSHWQRSHKWTLKQEYAQASGASCDFYRDLTEKPHNQPEITTGFLFIHAVYNPSGFFEQLFGTSCISCGSKGSWQAFANPSSDLFLLKTTHQAISMSFIIKKKRERLTQWSLWKKH